MKKLLAIVFIIISVASYGQAGYINLNEKRRNLLFGSEGFNGPAGQTPALASGQWTRAGALYYDSTGANKGYYYWTGSVWIKLADTTYTGFGSPNTSIGTGFDIGWTGTNFVRKFSAYSGLTGDTSGSANTVRVSLRGELTQYSPIVLNGFPLTINHNGVIKSAQNDSNFLRFTTNTLTTASTDTNITSGIQFFAQGRKTTGGAASVPVSFSMDMYAFQANPSGGGILQLKSKRTTEQVLFSIDAAAVIQQNFNVKGITIGNYAAVGSGLEGIVFGTNNLIRSSNPALNLGAGLIAIGTSALTNHKTGDDDIAIGRSALVSDTTGTDNIAIGLAALGLNATGASNVAIGSYSLLSNTSGGGMVAIGYEALKNNTASSANHTAVGYNALKANTTGTFNTAVGYAALALNTTGLSSTAVGTNTLSANTTAQKNTFVGAGAAENTTTGGFNTGVGEDVFLHNITGTNNVAMGWLSLATATAGNGNTVIGYNAASITGGDYNIGIGYQALSGVDQLAAPTNVIGIGKLVFTKFSNSIVIGDSTHTTLFMGGVAAGVGTKAIRYNPTTRQFTYADTSSAGGGGTPGGSTTQVQYNNAGAFGGISGATTNGTTLTLVAPILGTPASGTLTNTTGYKLSSIVAATATNNIDNTSFQQVFQWNGATTQTGAMQFLSNSISSGSLFYIGLTSTAAASNTQKGMEIQVDGANATSTQTTYGSFVVNHHSGTASTNIGGYFGANTGDNNYAIQIVDGTQGAGKVLTSDANGKASWATPSGGSGTVTSVAAGYGTTFTTITGAGSVIVDTTVIVPKASTSLITSTKVFTANATYFKPGSDGSNVVLMDAGGTARLQLGTFFGVSTYAAIYASGTPSGTNYMLAGNNSQTLVGAPVDLYLRVNNSSYVSMLSGTTNFNVPISVDLNKKITVAEGSGGYAGQTTLVSGTKAITISGVTTSSRAIITLVTPSGVTLTTTYQAVCTANTLTIQANVAAGTINTADGSTLNYLIIN